MDKLYCGYEDAIEVFDLHYPGEGTRLYTTPTKSSKEGLKGIISALAFCPSYDPSSSYYAAGSLSPSSPYSSNVALFTETTGAMPVSFLGANSDGSGVRASVTQLQFNPTRPYILYAAFRRHGIIYSWDLRGDVSKPLKTFQRTVSNATGRPKGSSVDTNQKLKFDVDIGGRFLAVGDQEGDISVFDLLAGIDEDPVANVVPSSEPTLKFHGHEDAVGSTSFHPAYPLLLSNSGSRHFHHETPSSVSQERHSSSSSLESSDSDSDDDDRPAIVRRRRRPHPFTVDSSIKLWNFSGTDSAYAAA